jgi:predicted aspartyl protease
MQNRQEVHSFTVGHNGISPVLTSEVRIQQAFDPKVSQPTAPITKYVAIWDTGASSTAISNRLATECGLKPIGMCRIRTAMGETDACTYFVSLYLPNMVCIPQLRVNEAVLSDSDVLIGMDVIGSGDFVVTNYAGKTHMSFRMPSLEVIDFNKQKPATIQLGGKTLRKVGRNEPCPCGSGKKYKKCCGR